MSDSINFAIEVEIGVAVVVLFCVSVLLRISLTQPIIKGTGARDKMKDRGAVSI